MQGTQEAPGTCGSRGLCSVTQEHGECHVWDMGTWRTPRVGHRGVEDAMYGIQGRGGWNVWDTGAWRVPHVGHGGMEDAMCGIQGHGGWNVWDGGVEGVMCGIWGCGGCHMWDTSKATHAAGGNAMSGTLRTLKQDCFPQGVGRHFSQRFQRVWKFML